MEPLGIWNGCTTNVLNSSRNTQADQHGQARSAPPRQPVGGPVRQRETRPALRPLCVRDLLGFAGRRSGRAPSCCASVSIGPELSGRP